MNLQLKFKPNKISLETGNLMAEIQHYVMAALDVAEQRFIDLMAQEIDATSSAPEDWRKNIKPDLKHVNQEISDTMIKYYTGIGYESGSYPWTRAMVIAHGMGRSSDVRPRPIYAGPAGREVTNKKLDGLRIGGSAVPFYHELPGKWYHEGRDFVANATYIMTGEYIDIVQSELKRIIPANLFASHIKVS